MALTYNDFGKEMLEIIEDQLSSDKVNDHNDFGAIYDDLTIAKRNVEDALTRYNSAQYRIRGTWERRDPDKG